MAKRVPQDEKPYRPVQEALVRAVMNHQMTEQEAAPTEVAGSQRTAALLEELPTPPRTVGEGVGEPERDEKTAPMPTIEKLTREKRVLLTFSEEREIERLVGRVAEEIATPVKLSHFLRAYMTLLLHAENEITKRARQAVPLHRPPNGDPVALAQFEHRLAQILSAALRDAPPLR
jgi:hypothetical protein